MANLSKCFSTISATFINNDDRYWTVDVDQLNREFYQIFQFNYHLGNASFAALTAKFISSAFDRGIFTQAFPVDGSIWNIDSGKDIWY